MSATETETADFIRWDVLDNLHERLTDLAEQVRELADERKPGKLAMLDAPGNAQTIRDYFDALDEIGWYSAEQMEAAS